MHSWDQATADFAALDFSLGPNYHQSTDLAHESASAIFDFETGLVGYRRIFPRQHSETAIFVAMAVSFTQVEQGLRYKATLKPTDQDGANLIVTIVAAGTGLVHNKQTIVSAN